MQNGTKKEWSAPKLETLDVSETMYGRGSTCIDFVTTEDLDIYTPS